MYFGITVKQPWAEFIVTNLKPSENRSWHCKHRGVLIIHASKTPDETWVEKVGLSAKYAGKKHLRRLTIGSLARLDMVMKNGYVIGAVLMEDCLEDVLTDWCDHGVWHHRYRDAIKFVDPVKMTGRQKLFVVNNDIIQQLSATDQNSLKALEKLSVRVGLSQGL